MDFLAIVFGIATLIFKVKALAILTIVCSSIEIILAIIARLAISDEEEKKLERVKEALLGEAPKKKKNKPSCLYMLIVGTIFLILGIVCL